MPKRPVLKKVASPSCVHDVQLAQLAQLKNEPGTKWDAGKSRVDLIDPAWIEGVGQVLAYGAEKYGDRNFEQGMSWGRIYAAAQRHMLAFWRGELLDPDTGLSHLWHASCCLMMLSFHDAYNVGTDDRSDTYK